MTKDKLLELYERLKQNQLDVTMINKLKDYTDEEIDIILNSPHIDLILYTIGHNNFKLLHKEQRKQLLEIVSKTKTRQSAKFAYYLITIKDVVISGKIIELSKIISESSGYEQADIAYSAVQSLTLLTNKNCLEIIKLLCQIKSEKIASIVSIIVTDEGVLSNKNCLQLIKLVSECDEEYKADLSACIAKNKILLETNKAISYIRRIRQSKDQREARTIFSEAKREIETIKLQEKDSFWNVYNYFPEKALASLRNIDGNEEITPYTRKRKRNTNHE